MAAPVFPDPSLPPAAEQLVRALGPAAPSWAALIASVADRNPPITELWRFAGAGTGWSLRLLCRKRILLYLTPLDGAFQVGVVLGGKVVAAALAAGPEEGLRRLLEAAPRYAEGRGIRLRVAGPEDLAAAQALVALKAGR